jgi:hypothetical protein
MTRQLLAITALFGVLAVACGKYGPPVRTRSEPAAAGSSEMTEKGGTSAAEESEEKEKQR